MDNLLLGIILIINFTLALVALQRARPVAQEEIQRYRTYLNKNNKKGHF